MLGKTSKTWKAFGRWKPRCSNLRTKRLQCFPWTAKSCMLNLKLWCDMACCMLYIQQNAMKFHTLGIRRKYQELWFLHVTAAPHISTADDGIHANHPMPHHHRGIRPSLRLLILRNGWKSFQGLVSWGGVAIGSIERTGIDSHDYILYKYQTNCHAPRQLLDAGKGSGHSEHLIPPRIWQCFLWRCGCCCIATSYPRSL